MAESIQKQVAKAVNLLKRGGVVAFPTDTVYGLGALPSDVEAVKRIYEVKQRPLSMAMPLLLADAAEIEKVAVNISRAARLLICRYWPGALTLVCEKQDWIPDLVTAGGKTIALRVPDNRIALALIKGTGMPLIGTSANKSGSPSPITADEVKAQIGSKIDYIIDGGTTPLMIESTIVDVTSDPPKIIREGAISRKDIESTISGNQGVI
jgi:L-threonylcarbamoyladenylate synthase